MFQPFKLKSTLGRSHNVDLDDTLMAKKTFGSLGYYKTPSYGLTKYPDEPLFKGIESFQKDHGLRKDGVMKPGGQTERTLQARLGMENASKNALFVDTFAIENSVAVTRYAVALEAVALGRGKRRSNDKT